MVGAVHAMRAMQTEQKVYIAKIAHVQYRSKVRSDQRSSRPASSRISRPCAACLTLDSALERLRVLGAGMSTCPADAALSETVRRGVSDRAVRGSSARAALAACLTAWLGSREDPFSRACSKSQGINSSAYKMVFHAYLCCMQLLSSYCRVIKGRRSQS